MMNNRFRDRKARFGDTDYKHIPAKRAARTCDESTSTTIELGTIDRHFARVERGWRWKERAGEQVVSSWNIGRYSEVFSVVQTDDHGREPPGETAQEEGELGGQRDQKPIVHEIEEGFNDHRAEKWFCQIMGKEGDASAATASYRYLAHLSRLVISNVDI